MKLAIMQPYFFPYIGYFQLIRAADKFVVYDNIKYTKKGWINRNRMLQNGKDVPFSLPLKSASDSSDIRDRELTADFNPRKLLNQIRETYRKAPYCSDVYPLLEVVLLHNQRGLFEFLHHSLVQTCNFLRISTPVEISSQVAIDHSLRSQEKVLAICSELKAEIYINPIGGVDLYAKEDFNKRGIDLQFMKSTPFVYRQFENQFVPWLSIIDVMMFNSVDAIADQLISKYELT